MESIVYSSRGVDQTRLFKPIISLGRGFSVCHVSGIAGETRGELEEKRSAERIHVIIPNVEGVGRPAQSAGGNAARVCIRCVPSSFKGVECGHGKRKIASSINAWESSFQGTDGRQSPYRLFVICLDGLAGQDGE